MPESLETLVPRSLQMLASETLFRAPEQSGFLLNPGDPGLVETVRALSAEQASKRPGPGRKPIVAHVNHVLYGLSLLNRALRVAGATTVALVILLEVPGASLLAWAFWHQQPPVATVPGALLVLVGLGVVVRSRAAVRRDAAHLSAALEVGNVTDA